MNTRHTSRRAFLRGTGLGAAALLGSSLDLFSATPWLAPAHAAAPAARPAGLLARSARQQMEPFVPDAEMVIEAVKKTVQILPGAQTNVWGYEGALVGTPSGVTLQNLPGNYLGPIIRAESGKKVRITVRNLLDEPTVLHPHGLRVPHDADGQPMHAFPPSPSPLNEKVYEFQVIDPACPAWFHPHPMGRTAEQVYMGLAGLFYVTDDAEKVAVPGAASGANDVPVIIQDRLFDSSNQFLYQPNNMWGMLGNTILVNGKPNAALSLEPRAYRLRFLNGSNARTYKLGWSNGMPLKVIGTDGGLLPAAVSKSYVMLMPGERVDVWADFSSLRGKQVVLRSLAFTPGMMGGGGMGGGGMGGGGMGGGGGGMGGGGMGSSLANGAAFDILTVNVGRKASATPALGPLPALQETYSAGNVANFDSPVPFTLGMQQMVWTINGLVYNMEDMMEVAEDEMVDCDQPIAWEWINSSPIPHPMHIHSVQFQVVKRTSPGTSSYATANQGFVDSGWKDTVTVWPGERVKIAMRPGPYTGMYMYHCHILEHEDMTMMRNYMIMDPMMPGGM